MAKVSIAGIDKARLLQALFNGSKQQGLGFLNTEGASDMSLEKAQEIISLHQNHPDKWPLSFYYLLGRVMKVNITNDEMETNLYNRDVGEDAAERVIASLRDNTVSVDTSVSTQPESVPEVDTTVTNGTEEE